MNEDSNVQTQWSKWDYVLMELKEINTAIKELKDAERANAIKLARVEERIAIRSGLFGALGAALVVSVTLLIQYLKK